MSIWVVISLSIALLILLTLAIGDTRPNTRRAKRWLKAVLGFK